MDKKLLIVIIGVAVASIAAGLGVYVYTNDTEKVLVLSSPPAQT